MNENTDTASKLLSPSQRQRVQRLKAYIELREDIHRNEPKLSTNEIHERMLVVMQSQGMAARTAREYIEIVIPRSQRESTILADGSHDFKEIGFWGVERTWHELSPEQSRAQAHKTVYGY